MTGDTNMFAQCHQTLAKIISRGRKLRTTRGHPPNPPPNSRDITQYVGTRQDDPQKFSDQT